MIKLWMPLQCASSPLARSSFLLAYYFDVCIHVYRSMHKFGQPGAVRSCLGGFCPSKVSTHPNLRGKTSVSNSPMLRFYSSPHTDLGQRNQLNPTYAWPAKMASLLRGCAPLERGSAAFGSYSSSQAPLTLPAPRLLRSGDKWSVAWRSNLGRLQRSKQPNRSGAARSLGRVSTFANAAPEGQQRDRPARQQQQQQLAPQTTLPAGSLFGAIALITSSTTGAGMLALPAVTAPAGFLPTAATLTAIWALLTVEALLIVSPAALLFSSLAYLHGRHKNHLIKKGLMAPVYLLSGVLTLAQYICMTNRRR